MQIKKIELSPIPILYSVKSTRLIFSKREISILKQASKILRDAEDKVLRYLKDPSMTEKTWTLSDIDPDLAEYFHAGFGIEELLEAMNPVCNGLQIEN